MTLRFALPLVVLAGCAAHYEVRPTATTRYDAVIIPGCPSEEDGALSDCQMSRAAWGAILWQRGLVGGFITSGAAVHSPYVEADAIAAGLAALGVPPDRIWLDENALHTDENMYFSLRIARALGFAHLAVASQKGHAAWSCRMLEDWGQRDCGAFSVDMTAVVALDPRAQLRAVRTGVVPGWVPLAERERAIARKIGRHRPPSYFLYPMLGWLRLNGERWTPYGPPGPPTVTTWAERLRSAQR
ncbi:MAG: ElyC/SanA/YdcF family protein [Polyangia bacterium]